MKRTAFLIFLSLAAAFRAGACDTGFQAFQNTVYAKIRRDCVGCHGGAQGKAQVDAPPFAVADPLKSYNQLIHYVNFSNLPQSLLVIRAGNNHCQISLCQAASGQDMAAQVTKWWQGGENQCKGNGTFLSQAVVLPAKLPAEKDGFTQLTVDLSSIKPELKGISFQIEAQDYLDASAQTSGAFRFRFPRFVGGSQSIYVKGVKILLNGAFAPTANNYAGIDKTVPFFSIQDPARSATPILSGDTVLILKDGSGVPTITVSFDDIEVKSDAPSCSNLAGYSSHVKPVINTLNCASCHQAHGTSVGEKTLDLSGSDARACQAASSLLNTQYLQISALIKVPSSGVGSNHPQLTDDQRAQYVSALRAWLAE